MTSILGRVTEDHVHGDPYPYLTISEALEPGYYHRLAAHFPDFSDIYRKYGSADGIRQMSGDNRLVHLGGHSAFARHTPIHPVWHDFMRFHFSRDFYLQVVGRLGDGIRRNYPDLENRLGKRLDELTVQPRNMPDQGADVLIDVQFAINTPVRKASRVRSHHVDDPKKLFAGLFYCRAPEDDSIGGDLEISRWRDRPRFLNPYVPGRQLSNTHIEEHQIEVVNTVHYKANTLLLFVNSPFAVHGVTERQPTPHLRRYVNFVAEMREPLYDIRQY